mgnify:CR=1 FL=1
MYAEQNQPNSSGWDAKQRERQRIEQQREKSDLKNRQKIQPQDQSQKNRWDEPRRDYDKQQRHRYDD